MLSTPVMAAAQTIPIAGDVDANIEQHLQLAKLAAEEGAQLLLFPELSLTGYEMDRAAELAFSESDPRLAPLIEAASTLGLILCVGAPVRVGSGLHIANFNITPDRSIALYTKHHLAAFSSSDSPDGVIPAAEYSVFVPGDRNPLIQLGGRTIASSICFDSMPASHPAQAARLGANVYLSSQFGIVGHIDFKVLVLEKHAVKHGMAIVIANFGGPSGGLPAGGTSGIWSERGACVTKLAASGCGVALASQQDGQWQGRAIML